MKQASVKGFEDESRGRGQRRINGIAIEISSESGAMPGKTKLASHRMVRRMASRIVSRQCREYPLELSAPFGSPKTVWCQ